MCTAAVYKTKDFYFGRTLDYDFSYGEEIVVIPRNYSFNFRCMGRMEHIHPAVMLIVAFITTLRMKIIRLQQLICTKKIWMASC